MWQEYCYALTMTTQTAAQPFVSYFDDYADMASVAMKNVECGMAYDFGAEEAENVIDVTRAIIKDYFERGVELIGWGRTRIVFAYDENNVVKIPFTFEGYNASSAEVRTCKGYKENPHKYIPTAECRFETLTTSHGEIDVLIMENVEPTHLDYSEMPDWVGYVDCGQVGYNRKGELVAYDL